MSVVKFENKFFMGKPAYIPYPVKVKCEEHNISFTTGVNKSLHKELNEHAKQHYDEAKKGWVAIEFHGIRYVCSKCSNIYSELTAIASHYRNCEAKPVDPLEVGEVPRESAASSQFEFGLAAKLKAVTELAKNINNTEDDLIDITNPEERACRQQKEALEDNLKTTLLVLQATKSKGEHRHLMSLVNTALYTRNLIIIIYISLIIYIIYVLFLF